MALISPYTTTWSALHKQEWSDMHKFGFEVSFTSQNNWKIRFFPKPVGKIAITSWLEIRSSNASLCSAFRGSIFRKHDKHSCSASAIINLSMVSIVDSCCQRFKHQPIIFLRCKANAYFIGSGCAGSLSFFVLGCCPHFWSLVVLLLDAQCSLMQVANWRKKRDCSQSTTPGKREALPA